jgi:hypothetical protein
MLQPDRPPLDPPHHLPVPLCVCFSGGARCSTEHLPFLWPLASAPLLPTEAGYLLPFSLEALLAPAAVLLDLLNNRRLCRWDVTPQSWCPALLCERAPAHLWTSVEEVSGFAGRSDAAGRRGAPAAV